MTNFIELGLPSKTKWATTNYGANKPDESGIYIDWDKAMALEGFKIPTAEQWQELIDNCEWTWTSGGYNVTGPNGNSIFLPAAGYRDGTSLNFAGSYGYFWSSSLDSGYPYYACYLYFNSGGVSRFVNNRYYGLSVRPVSE